MDDYAYANINLAYFIPILRAILLFSKIYFYIIFSYQNENNFCLLILSNISSTRILQ